MVWMGIGEGFRGGPLLSFSILCLIHECFLVLCLLGQEKKEKKRFVGQEFRDLCSLRVSLETIYLIFNTRFLNCLFRKKNIIINTLSKLSRISNIFLH